MPPLQVFTIAGPGGLNESTGDAPVDAYLQAENSVIYRGRLAARAPIFDIINIKDSGGTNDVDAILGMAVYDGKLLVAGYSDTLNEVNLVELPLSAASQTHKAVIWSSVTAQPTAVIMEPFTAGTATAGEKRLYIADFDQTFVTRYWNGTALADLTADLNLDTTAEDVHFSYIKQFQFHLWGVGFYEGTTTRPEMLRFSTPGAIPLTDIGDGGSRPWHAADHMSIGRRGAAIMGLEVLTGWLLVFQQNAVHAISGYSRDTWTVTPLSPNIGAVGPLAFDHYAGRLCFFWSATGPMITDGTEVIDIGEPIRKRLGEVPSDTNIICKVDPTTMMAYFFIPDGGSWPNMYFGFQILGQRWTEGAYLDSAGTAVNIGSGVRVIELGTAGAGPAAAPTLSDVTLNDPDSDTKLDLVWVNGDVAINTQTKIHRDTSPAFTPGPSNLVDTVENGVTTYTDDDGGSLLSGDTQYYYQLRHIRNGQHSSASNEDSATTALARPSDFVLSPIVNGIKLTFTNNVNLAEINIDRKPEGGSYSDLTTLNNQASGTVVYNDTTATCASTYGYRIRTEETAKTSSPWVEPTPAELEACSGVPSISDVWHEITTDPLKPWIKRVKLHWTRTNWEPYDRVWVYSRQPAGSGGYDKLAEVYEDYYSDIQRSCPGQDNVDYKLVTKEDNQTTVDTDYYLNKDPCVEV